MTNSVLTSLEIAARINSIVIKLPSLRIYLGSIFIDIVEQLIVNYLVPYPIGTITASKDNGGLFIKDMELYQFLHDNDAPKIFKFKFFYTNLYNKKAQCIFQIFEMYDDCGKPLFYQDLYHCQPVTYNNKWHGVKFIIPKKPLFDFLTRFLTCDTNEGVLSILSCVPTKPAEYYIFKKFNPTNEMYWGYHDADDNFWHFKKWILHFLFDITNFLLQSNYRFSELKESLTYDSEFDGEYHYPWTSNNVLYQSCTFPITWENNEICNYFIGFYKRPDIQLPKLNTYNDNYNHYYIKIENSSGKLKYIRGSMVGINPVSAWIFFTLSRQDEELYLEYPFISPYAFRRLLLQNICLIHDWN